MLNSDEFLKAELFWLQYVQQRSFASELKSLKKGSSVSQSSPLKALSPFIGEDFLLRFGGRLKNSALGYDEQHPIILPRGPVSALLIDRIHKDTLHGGVQLVLRMLRQCYWLLGGRSAVKSHIRQCVLCARHSARLSSQLMENLSSSQVNPSPPFSHTGVDYAGPFLVTPFVGRGHKARKSYIALFICLVTKAIHLELVEDYSMAGFLVAFKRFCSRRRLPKRLYSDNGTNFRGADHELKRHFDALVKEPALRDVLIKDGVDWHFISAAASHLRSLGSWR
nr:PREDICTED: uncharacterized protein LOC105668051 [Linepithema humile]